MSPFELVVMTPSLETARTVHQWRNDPDTLRMSFNATAYPFELFYPQFLLDYFLIPDLPSLFATHKGEKVAYIRFRPYVGSTGVGNEAEISINVAPQWRGKGIASRLLQQMNDFAKRQGYDTLYAEIKPENIASIKAFQNAGYTFVTKATHEIEKEGVLSHCPIELYRMKLAPKKKAPVFVIAEAGSNWRLGDIENDLKVAETMIYAAKDAGCDAIKFQTFSAEPLYVPNAGSPDYLKVKGTGKGVGKRVEKGSKEDIKNILSKIAMPHEVIGHLAAFCKKARIEFMSTAFSVKDFKALDPYVKRHKIASYELSHIRLLECAASSKKPLILSTGASTLSDIAWAVDFFQARSKASLIVLQCTAQYPAKASGMHLHTIPWMRRYFHIPCGLSDHSLDPFSAPLAAVALGAAVIEKHFTLDRRLPGPDHSFSLEPNEIKEMTSRIREVEEMLGEGVKRVFPEEEELFFFAKRAIQAIQPIKKGELLKEGKNIAILRPGYKKKGAHPRYIEEANGKRAARSIALGEGIRIGDWIP